MKTNKIFLPAFCMAMQAWFLMAHAGQLQIPSLQAVLGEQHEVRVAVEWVPSAGDALASLQFDLAFDPQFWQLSKVDAGPAAGNAGKRLQWKSLGNNRLRLLVYGINQTTLPPGQVALITLNLLPQALPGVTWADISNSAGATPHAHLAPLNAGHGSITLCAPDAAASLENAKAYPNPFRPGRGHLRVLFYPLPRNTQIKIYRLAGECVAQLEAPAGGMLAWDAGNQAGNRLASGVYIYVISDNQGKKKSGKVAIIR